MPDDGVLMPADYTRHVLSMYLERSGIAKCDACGSVVACHPLANAARPADLLVSMEVEHALEGCNGSLGWLRP